MAKKKKDGRVNNGGARPNSGPKNKKPYTTTVRRVPDPLLPEVDRLISDFKVLQVYRRTDQQTK
jgi:hypothetical protein